MHTLNVGSPFDFQKSLAFLGGFSPMRGEQALGLELRKATRLGGQIVGFVVRPAGAALEAELFPERPLLPDQEKALLERLSFFLALEVDLRPFYALAQQDQRFQPVLNDLYGFHQPRFLTPFEVACWGVIADAASTRPQDQAGDLWAVRRRVAGPARLSGTARLGASKRKGLAGTHSQCAESPRPERNHIGFSGRDHAGIGRAALWRGATLAARHRRHWRVECAFHFGTRPWTP